MAKMSRVSLARKRQLQEPDRFVAFLQTTGQFLTAHRRSVAAGVSAFLLLVVIGSVVFYLHQKSEKEAFYRLSAVMNRVAADQEQKPAAQQERFHAIYTNHDNSLAGQIAALKYADTCYQTGKTVAAIETYRDLV